MTKAKSPGRPVKSRNQEAAVNIRLSRKLHEEMETMALGRGYAVTQMVRHLMQREIIACAEELKRYREEYERPAPKFNGGDQLDMMSKVDSPIGRG
jgi:hypothetical protein